MLTTPAYIPRPGALPEKVLAYFAANPEECLTAEDIAEQIFWVASLPPHLNINRLELMPVSQSFAGFQVAREG